MKMWRIIFILTFCLILTGKALAVCPTFTPTTATNVSNVKILLENYNCYLDSNSNEYILNFSKNYINNQDGFKPNINFPLSLNNTSDKLVRIIGLKLDYDSTKEAVSPYITFSGSKIAFQDSTLTGPGSGTAIQIAASASATISSLACSNFTQCVDIKSGASTAVSQGSFTNVTTGINVATSASASITQGTFTNAITAINVAKDAAALVTQGKFTNVTTPIKYEEIPASAGMTEEWTGKHVNGTDVTKVDRIAGKLDVAECKGSVEMYLFKAPEQVGQQQLLTYHAICTVSELKDDTLELTAADGTKKEIAEGACYFDCSGIDVLKDNYVSFAYTSSSDLPDLKVGTTSQFTPFPAAKISDMQDVIWVPLIGESGPGTSNMNGGGSTVYVEQFGTGAGDGTDKIDNDKLFISTGDQKVKDDTLDTNDTSDDPSDNPPDEQISGSSAASLCTLITSANSPQAWPLVIWLMALPVILIRRFK